MQTPVPEQVCFRCDLPAWLDTLSERDCSITQDLMIGERTMDVANKYRLSPGRISQLRRELFLKPGCRGRSRSIRVPRRGVCSPCLRLCVRLWTDCPDRVDGPGAQREVSSPGEILRYSVTAVSARRWRKAVRRNPSIPAKPSPHRCAPVESGRPVSAAPPGAILPFPAWPETLQARRLR
jgi:hypothetical protein